MLINSLRAPNVEFIHYEPGGALPLEQITLAIYQSMRSRRHDRVAVMGNEGIEPLRPKLDAEYLQPDCNYHWSGIQWRAQKGRKRILLGDYEDWFKWYMRHQRFKAFHVVIMIEPRAALSDEERGGYFAGFLARLTHKVPFKVIVVETREQTEANGQDPLYIQEALLAMLYGSRLSHDELFEIAGLAFVPLGDAEALRKSLDERWLWAKYHSRYELRENGEKFLQGMAPPKPSYGMEPLEIEPLFEPRKRSAQRYTLPNSLLREMLLEDVRERGWVSAYDEWPNMAMKLEALAGKDGSEVQSFFWGRGVSHEEARDALAPSPWLLRRILDGLVDEGQLEKRTWFREVGRPSIAYHLPGKVPFLEQRCGQCVFYVHLRTRCRLWWLVNKAHSYYNPRWKETGSGVSPFDTHKMKNSWRIGPHSSACKRFLDKKRDHLRKAVPQECEVCGNVLASGKPRFIVGCTNCGTKYVRHGNKVKVLTAYEHEFRRLYREVAGTDPAEDLRKWEENQADRVDRVLERAMHKEAAEPPAENTTIEEWPEPPRWLSVRYNQALQEQVDRLANATDIARELSIAMAKSAINATTRIATLVRLDKKLAQPAVSLQERYLSNLEHSSPLSLVTHEALIMKQYWHVFDLALKLAFTWFGPRKKARFVREYVGDPVGRDRGYSAIDAAINYLHHRRLLEAQRINMEVGFGERTCEGFLHRKQYNSRGLGLLLDMIDPFKFADREELLRVVLNRGLTWRDFRIESDRRGSNFYYPAPSGIAVLNQIGDHTDKTIVWYGGRKLGLEEAYASVSKGLFKAIDSAGGLAHFQPFVFGGLPT